jgi:V/A-type H+-transporting ATPase subunit E
MDVQLKELIETIKTEGVKEAEDKSAVIISEAEAQAKTILDAARKEADKIVASGKADAAKFEASGREAVKQASRDLLLKIQGQIEKLFDALVQKETSEAFSGKVLEESVVSVIKGWAEKGSLDLTVLLSEKDFKNLESSLRGRLSAEMKKGIEIKPFSGVDAGFRIAEKDGGSYYNFTAQGVAEMLSEFLNPRLAELMKEAGKE